jgi:uncharacterized protein YPO0396
MEALAAASSVFAVQLASNVQTLIEFWESMKEAPTEVDRIKSQLRILRALLQSIEVDTHQAATGDNNEIARACLVICATSILKLERLSTEFHRGLNGNGIQRNWTRLKKALREKKLAAYGSELERAKSTLIMYQGWTNGYVKCQFLCLLMLI